MRYAILSDIHANLEALDACVAHARAKGCDRFLVLGDLVGYGADPNAVVTMIQALAPLTIVRGNHDKIAIDLSEADEFNPTARSAARWTHDALTPERRAWLAALPQGPATIDDLVQICHGTPYDEDAYVFDELDARRALRAATRRVCFFGHTHVPVVFQLADDKLRVNQPAAAGNDFQVALQSDVQYLINPGSVGQPRDGNPRAGYAIVEPAKARVDMFRVPYAIETAQAKILAAGLPEILALRLASGR